MYGSNTDQRSSAANKDYQGMLGVRCPKLLICLLGTFRAKLLRQIQKDIGQSYGD